MQKDSQRPKKYFARYKEPLVPFPNLIEAQTKSFEWLVETGIKEVFKEFSPISDYSGKKFELEFTSFNYKIKPKAGMLIGFPSDHRYLHAALPTLSGTRYVIVSWGAVLGNQRIHKNTPYASIILRTKDT